MGQNVKLFMNNTENCKIVMGEKNYEKSIFSSTALQRPDIQKTRLTCMLRRALREQASRKKQQTYWKAFMASCMVSNANSNDRA